MARILIMDDEADVRDFLRRGLESAGHEVDEAIDGLEGVRQFRQNPADVVILDIFMPVKSGLEAIEELKRDYPELKIIAISGVDLVRDGIDLATMTKSYGVHRTVRTDRQGRADPEGQTQDHLLEEFRMVQRGRSAQATHFQSAAACVRSWRRPVRG